MQLTDLPNIGPVLAERLHTAGITAPERKTALKRWLAAVTKEGQAGV